MDFVANRPDYDYIICDANGRRGVKDGKEFPITEEEYRRENPYHKDVGCKECTFVQDKETLLVYLVPRELKNKATDTPLFVGKFTMPGWTGHSSFYLFWCRECEIVVVDYPHGYTPLGSCYLSCSKCGSGPILRKKEDYVRDNLSVPLVALGFKERYEKILKTYEEIEKLPIDVSDIVTEAPASRGSRLNLWSVGLVLLALYTLGIFLLRYSGILN